PRTPAIQRGRLPIEGRDLLPGAAGDAVDPQVRRRGDERREPAHQRGAGEDSVPAGRAVEPDCKTRSNTEGDDAPGEHEQPGLGQDEPEGDGGDDSGDQANKRWQEYARGEVSQAVDIADEEVERLLAVQHSPDRRS